MNNDFEIADGVLIKYHGSEKNVVIPDGVREIGAKAFDCCYDVVWAAIPDSVTKIGDGAFKFCKGLNAIDIPNSVLEIGEAAFFNCEKLSCVHMSENVRNIGDGAFNCCRSLASVIIPNGVTKIRTRAFWGCISLASLVIPESVTEIENGAFGLCAGLDSVSLTGKIKRIGERAFENCTSITSVTIPDGVKSIEDHAFRGCTSISLMTLPDSLTEICSSAFSGCDILTVVCNENSYAHRYCEKEHVMFIFDYQYNAFNGVVPPGIERLSSPFPADEEKPFIFISYSHKDRDSILPILKWLYEIGWKIWYDEGLTIGDKYDEVLEEHIKNCSAFLFFATGNSINSYYIKENEIPWAQKFEKPIIKCILDEGIDYEINEGNVVTTIAENSIEAALENIQGLIKGEKRIAKGLSVVANPNERGEKSGNGIAYCIYSEKSAAIAKSILLEAKMSGCNIHDAVRNGEDDEKLHACVCLVALIDKEFIADTHLMELLIAEFNSGKDIAACQIEEIDESDMPDELIELHRRHWLDFAHGIIPDMITRLSQYLQKRGCRKAAVLPGFDYEITEIGIAIKRYKGFAHRLRIEREYGGMPVIEIADRAFENNIHLESVEIPDSIRKIGDFAFCGCTKLTSMTIPSSVTEIGASAFESCSNLLSVTISESVTEIKESTFSGCMNLTSVIIPFGVMIIGKGAFTFCRNISVVVIPNSVYKIGEGAFKYCLKLTSVIIPVGVVYIGKEAFEECKNLNSIIIPDSVIEIGEGAFRYCAKLTSVIIPETVTEIGKDAFLKYRPYGTF